MSDKKIIFIHIPKTAGTSIHKMLEETFGKEACCPQNILGPRTEVVKTGLDRKYRVFSGHINRQVESTIVYQKFVFTFLRDPIDRIISLFNFWRSHSKEIVANSPALLGPKLARENSFYDFLSYNHEIVQCAVNNSYGHTLTHYPFIEYAKRVSSFTPDEDNAVIEESFRYLTQIDFVGVLEELHGGTPKELRAIGLPPVAPKERTKESLTKVLDFPLVKREDLDEKTLEKLYDLTRIDQVIFDAVCSKRFAE